MFRYFIEVSYKGTRYSGFQIQDNARTIQSEITAALQTFYRRTFELTGSSRTDAGVHAKQNYFHFDSGVLLNPDHIYNINSILPQDIAVLSLRQVHPTAHCRFDAVSRLYHYYIYFKKNPFYIDTAWYYPYNIDMKTLQQTSALILGQHDFKAFSKRNTQVNNFICNIKETDWVQEGDQFIFKVEANRFLRGMVRALTATQLKVARKSIDLQRFKYLLNGNECSSADFSAPATGLFLARVVLPEEIFV